MKDAVLDRFRPEVRDWFTQTFGAPTPPQLLGWPAIADGQHVLITAPTGSGKTLAAFLWCVDRLLGELAAGRPLGGVHTLYISPLKALGYDIERNLRAPLRGIRRLGRAAGAPLPEVQVAVRTGDTRPAQRAAMLRHPPQILITTPESLLILLSSPRARGLLAAVRFVIVDEIHALLGNKRGQSLALCLERLAATAPADPARIGLSATVQPLEQAARFLGGLRWQGEHLVPRPVRIVAAGQRKALDLQVTAPVADFTALPADSIWREVYPLLQRWIAAHRSTLIFTRMRAQAERLSRALNELAGAPLAAAHHSSLAPELRRELELQLKRGELKALISTGTMELGIDMGAVDLVVQLGSPAAVGTGLQRVGRAGHVLSSTSKGRVVALYREDLVESAVIGQRMLRGQVEPTRLPQNALDVLAQHLVSAVATAERPLTGADLLRLCRQAAPYAELSREALDAVLALLAGRYPVEVVRGLSAKLTWEQTTDRVAALPGARQLVVTAGGTIPDRGYYALQLPDGTRLGELEEEFVFERRLGDVIAFGSSSWRILEIDTQRVTVAPAPGQPAVIPFWKGGLFGRDPELSEAVGAFRRELMERLADPEDARRWLADGYPLAEAAQQALVRYFSAQREQRAAVGTDRQLVVEAFADDLGDHRLVIHSVFGNRVNAPLALALRRRLRQRLGVDPQVLSDDNALLLRIPAGELALPLDLLSWLEPDEVERLVVEELAGSALYGTLFRQNAARFLVLGQHGAGRRTPLWLQRLRAKDLQQATAELPAFPVRLETFRECLQDLMDLPRLVALLRRVQQGELSVVQQRRAGPSPVAAGLLNRFIGQYMYEYDEPRAERDLRQLRLDCTLLDQLLRKESLAELLLPEAVGELEQRWQGLDPRARARTSEELLALLQRVVLLPEQEISARCQAPVEELLAPLLADKRVCRLQLGAAAGPEAPWYLCASDDRALLARAQGAAAPERPANAAAHALADSANEARRALVRRVIEQRGPSTLAELAVASGLPPAAVSPALASLQHQGAVVGGALRGDTPDETFCLRANLEQIRRRSLKVARARVAPVPPAALQQLILQRQHLGPDRLSGREGLAQVIQKLQLRPLPVEALEQEVLRARVSDYQPAWLDELVSGGLALWRGSGPRRVSLLPRERLALAPALAAELSAAARAVLAALQAQGACFISELVGAVSLPLGELQRGLWELVWAGLATNDRYQALRAGLAQDFAPSLPPAANPLTGRPAGFGRPRPPRLARRRLTAPVLEGRWSALRPPAAQDSEAVGRGWVEILLERYGLLARELVELEEGISWGALYPLLRELELTGELGRGLFVAGLSAAQFAPAAAVDALRAAACALGAHDAPVLLSAWDPALVAPALGQRLPAGAALARRPGTHAVLARGEVALVLEGGGKALYLAEELSAEWRRQCLALLPELLQGRRAVRVERINGRPAGGSPWCEELEQLGFRRDGQALERRRFG